MGQLGARSKQGEVYLVQRAEPTFMEEEGVEVEPVVPKDDKKVTRMTKVLDPDQRSEVISYLVRNYDVFV